MSEDNLRELNRLRREKRKLVSRHKLQELSNVCNRMGEILSRQGKYEDALQEHRDEEVACIELDDSLGVAIANRKIGECYSELGSYSEALQHQRKHLEIAVRLNSVVEEQRAWATIGRTHLYQAEIPAEQRNTNDTSGLNMETLEALNKAEEAFLKSLDLCSRLLSNVEAKELAQMQGRLFLNLGLVLQQRGDLDGGSGFIQKAIDINKEYHLLEDLQRCHHSLCLLFKRHGKLTTALFHVKEAINKSSKCIDIDQECELLTLQGHICLLLSDFKGAKRVLRKTRKMTTLVEGDIKTEAFRIWKAAAKLCAAEERLLCLESDDLYALRTIYEKMGDLCCSVENYEGALRYYHRLLELTEELRFGNKDLAPIYLSLAQTYSDTGQYEQATHYYQLELNCWSGNNVETCKTLLNISCCEEQAGKDYLILKNHYDAAIHSARNADDDKLLRRCLKSLLAVQTKFGESKMETLNMLETFDIVSEDDDDSVDECEIHDDSSVPSDEMSTSDDEGPNTLLTRHGQSRQKKFRLRRNEKGETPLHRACIDGDVKLVKKLLDQGHPINIRDYSGWLPLHEASNHDHADVVELLLDHGAWINDRGGEHCDGITPLHDAASNGNLAVIRVLLKRGASVLVKTTSGETVLDCLVNWQKRAECNTDSEILSQSEQLANELKEAMKNLHGVHIPQSQLEINKVVNSTCEALICEDDDHQTITNTATSDDWLVNDAQPSRKRRRSNRSPIDHESTSSARRIIPSARRKTQTCLRVEKRPRTYSVERTEENNQEFQNEPYLDYRMRSPESDIERTSSPTLITSDKGSSSFLRIKVKILDKLLLVPSPAGETIGWLANEAAHRYYILHGLRPVISLSTREGALLGVIDLIHHVMSADDEVIGTIDSWDLPPLNGRYLEACTALSEIPCENITSILMRAQEGRSDVRLSNKRLTGNQIRPILRALQCQYSLSELTLSGNRFGETGLQYLGQAIIHLPGVQVLDLSCNDITDKGLSHLASAVLSTPRALQRLKTLNISYNPLIEGPTSACPNLSSFLNELKSLEELYIQSCCESLQWPHNLHLLKSISQLNSLLHLDMSFNRFSLEHLNNHLGPALKALPFLRKLCLRGISVSVETTRPLCKVLTGLFTNPQCQLEEVDLTLCYLDDECVNSLTAAVGGQLRAVKLKIVGMPGNTS